MGFGSVERKQRAAFIRLAGKYWKKEVTSPYKARLLLEKLGDHIDSYTIRKREILHQYIDSQTKSTFEVWFDNERPEA